MPFARMALIGILSLALGIAAQARAASGAMEVVLPMPHSRPATAGAEALRPVPQFDGCRSTPISCNADVQAQLATGDCIAANNTLFDEYAFSGSAQELVTATVRPLSLSYTDPWIAFVVPEYNTASVPTISGGPAATVRYVLPLTGAWRLRMGSNDRLGAGGYVVEMSCDDQVPLVPFPSPQLDCVEQELLCGQQATWNLTSASCISSSDPNRFYGMYRVYGVAGDTLNMQLTSTDFDPQFGVYQLAVSDSALAQSSALDAMTDTLSFLVPHDGFYDVLVTSGNANGTGQYTLTLDCNRSGCLTPIIIKQPEDVTVALSATASVSVQATALGDDITYVWTDADTLASVGITPTYTTGPITGPHNYFVTATTPCGSVQSRVVHVQVLDLKPPPPPFPPRHRAARH